MLKPEPGISVELEDGVRLLLAPNPGAMTHWGTNTYVVGEGHVGIVDPGPDSQAHYDALAKATAGETVTHILVTHAHADHSPLARKLSQATGAPILGYGPAHAGRSPLMEQLAQTGSAGGGEGVDTDFEPDIELRDNDTVDGQGWTLDVLHTPGHFAGHLSFAFNERLFSGDHVMDWSSTLVSPPDGDIASFMSTCERLLGFGASRLYPAHGAHIDAVETRLIWLMEHRRARETSILDEIGGKSISLLELTRRVYTDLEPAMLPFASRNVFAHLIDLVDRNLVAAQPTLAVEAQFRLR